MRIADKYVYFAHFLNISRNVKSERTKKDFSILPLTLEIEPVTTPEKLVLSTTIIFASYRINVALFFIRLFLQHIDDLINIQIKILLC